MSLHKKSRTSQVSLSHPQHEALKKFYTAFRLRATSPLCSSLFPGFRKQTCSCSVNDANGEKGPRQGCAGGCQAWGWQLVKWHPGAGGLGCRARGVREEEPCPAHPLAPHPQHSSAWGQPARSLGVCGNAGAAWHHKGREHLVFQVL